MSCLARLSAAQKSEGSQRSSPRLSWVKFCCNRGLSSNTKTTLLGLLVSVERIGCFCISKTLAVRKSLVSYSIVINNSASHSREAAQRNDEKKARFTWYFYDQLSGYRNVTHNPALAWSRSYFLYPCHPCQRRAVCS